MFYGFYDPTYILVIIGVILSLVASARVRSTLQNIHGYGVTPDYEPKSLREYFVGQESMMFRLSMFTDSLATIMIPERKFSDYLIPYTEAIRLRYRSCIMNADMRYSIRMHIYR